MSGEFTNAAPSSTRLLPYPRPTDLPARPDDPRLGQVVDFWTGGLADLPTGRPVIVGFPQDEGVRRNGGRVGAALAPDQIRHWLYRRTTVDASPEADLARLGLIDVGNVAVSRALEASQTALGQVVAELLFRGATPVVLGGGRETAYGVYLGHLLAGYAVGFLNLDAHLDVRPTIDGLGHSGSPFRQAMEHPEHPLPGNHYACIGAQPFSVSREHLDYVRGRGGVVTWRDEVAGRLAERMRGWVAQHATVGAVLHLSIDADVVRAADVPGVSAPNPTGLAGDEVAEAAFVAGAQGRVGSVELVEINPRYDLDDRSSRWGALAVWNFLSGVARRTSRA